MRLASTLFVLFLTGPVLAQQSQNFRLSDYSFNGGGFGALESDSYRLTMSSVAEPASASGAASDSYHMDGSFGACYRPPAEVANLFFTGKQNLQWSPDPSVGVYNLYRDLMSNVSGLGYGDCEQQDIGQPAASDTDIPPVDDGYFYLVTAENLLGEEGTKGWHSQGSERSNANPCP